MDTVITYSVYSLRFPNGKAYYGFTRLPICYHHYPSRYNEQPQLRNAISIYGWENVEFVCELQTTNATEALLLQRQLIIDNKTYHSFGYNINCPETHSKRIYYVPELDQYFFSQTEVAYRLGKTRARIQQLVDRKACTREGYHVQSLLLDDLINPYKK